MRINSISLVLAFCSARNLCSQVGHPLITSTDTLSRIVSPQSLVAVPGGFVIIANSAPFVRMFDASGNLRSYAGGFGTHPGELRSTTGAAYLAGPRRLVVSDAESGRLNIYKVSADNLTFDRSAKVDVPIQDMCVLDGHLFVLGFKDDHIVHELNVVDSEYEVRRSFGEPRLTHPLRNNSMIRQRAAFGTMACDGGRHRIVVASHTFGEVMLLDRGGDQRMLLLPSFIPISITEEGRGLSFGLPREGHYDETLRVVAIGSNVYVTVGVVDGSHHGSGNYADIMVTPVVGPGLGEARHSRTIVFGALNREAVCQLRDGASTLWVYGHGACP